MTARGIIAVLPSLIKQRVEEKAYREYVTICAYNINEILAKQFSGGYVAVKYSDIIDPKPVDTRTAEDIKAEVCAAIRRCVGGEPK